MIQCAPGVLETIADHAQREAGCECCGLLIGHEDRLVEAVPVENRAPDPARRYEIDPRDFLAVIKRCRGTRRAVVGAYHSHPRSDPEPSAADLDEAFGGFLYVIAGPVGGTPPLQIRAYRLVDGNFRPIRLVPDPEEPHT